MIRIRNRRLPILLAAIVSLASGCDTGTDSSAPPQGGPDLRGVDAISTGETGSGSTGQGVPEPERPVVAETLPYAEVGEQLVYGHFAFPADMLNSLPGVIVIHERWGLDDGVRAQADRIAAQGYVVLAVDLFNGKTAKDAASSRPLMVEVVENPAAASDNIRQAYQFLIDSGQAPTIGALGWSFGGGWALNTALMYPDDLDAAVIYYGQLIDDERQLEALNVPILGLFGERDRGVTVESVEAFEAAMENLEKDFEIEIYPGVGHAFADPGASTYNAEVAEQAWTRSMDFLSQHLVLTAE
jgi:carboxymethylenebutenolidase